MPRDLDKIQADLDRAAREAEQAAADETKSTDLVHVGASAPAVKRELLRKKQRLETAQAQVERFSTELTETLREKEMEIREQIAPLEKMVKRLQEGIWTVSLYLGQQETIVTLRDGEPAPADTPITIRQLVLAMDEETAIDPEGGGIDFQNVEEFDEWLMESAAHLDQVLPDTKGVVAIRPRRAREKNYGTFFANEEAEKRNKHTYFLIRNGDKVFRIWTDFSVGQHMIPPANEFTKVFERKKYNWETKEHDVEQISPDDPKWEEAEEQMEARQRHYMRMGMVLQGLVDRTPIFHPLPEWGVSFLSSKSHKEWAERTAEERSG
jgi:hypothetical protein